LLVPEEGKTMVIDERSRLALHKRLEELLGASEAATLMEHLPPVGWADVATKRDLDQAQAATKRDLEHLQAATKRDLEHLEVKVKADVRGEFIAFQRNIIAWTTGLNAALVGLVFAAAKLS
jgi:hypothetical protein